MRDKSNIESMYYLSPLQQGLLFHRIADGGEDPYFYQYIYLLKGALRPDAFERAWQLVVERHPILRTAFIWEGVDKPVQVVRRQATLSIERHDWRTMPAEEHRRTLQTLLDQDRAAGWDFLVPPLMRLHLIRATEEEWLMINSHHHILLDGWSMALVLNDVMVAYEMTLHGRKFSLPAPRPYRDYVAWLNRQDVQQAESYWRDALKGFSTQTVLSIEPPRDREAEDSLPFAEQSLRISSERTAALQSFARQSRVTMNTMIQGAWALLLHRYSGESDVLFGTTVSGRPTDLAGAADMVGLFINTVPLRVAVHSDMPLSTWLRGIQEQNSLLRQYEWTSLASIQRWSENLGGRSLFDSLVVFESYPEVDAGGLPQALTVEPVSLHKHEGPALTTGRNNYPLSLMVEPGHETKLIVSYMHRRFAHAAISRLLCHFDTLLDNMRAAPERQLRELSLLPGEERRQLTAWNRSVSPSPAPDVCVHALIEAQAQERPEALAVVTETDQLSYRELDRRANRLAHYLQERGVGPETRVAICLERSLDLVIALLAVLKAGGAYVPLDPGYPKERLAHMVTDSGAVVVLSDSKQAGGLSGFGAGLVLLDRIVREIEQRDDHRPSTGVTPQNLAYVIYTSGSTGRPKGVAVEHRQIAQYVRTVLERLALPAEAGMAAVSTVAADLGNTALFGALCSGRPLHLLSAEHGFDPNAMAAYMHEHAVDVLKIVPSHLNGLLSAEHPERVLPRRCLILGGEALRQDLFERIRALAPACTIVNHYGPTETAVGVLTHRVEGVSVAAAGVPIGRPLSGTHVYVLDPGGLQVPIGMPGELYIGGRHVTRGYLDRPDITAERFLPDAFSGEAGSRLYRTGDRVRVRTDGEIEFLGRVDNQVKVRGFRIELGEIDAQLRSEPSIAEAVTVVRETPDGVQQLAAYIAGDSSIDTSEIRARLALRLPDYMVPQMIIVLAALPLTANGKLDRAALPDPQQQIVTDEASYVAPRNRAEETLAAIWADVLRIERIGIYDNFFDLGGDSILCLQIVGKAYRAGIKLTPKLIFQHHTVAAVAAALEESVPISSVQEPTQQAAPVEPFALAGLDPGRLQSLCDKYTGEIEDVYPASPVQQGMLFHSLQEEQGGTYHNHVVYAFTQSFDPEAFEKAWQQAVDRHAVLRTGFLWDLSPEPLQVVFRDVRIPVERLDWRKFVDDTARQSALHDYLANDRARGFTFDRPPLMRLALIQRAEHSWWVVWSLHHVILDGGCQGLLVQEVMTAYERLQRGEHPVSKPAPSYREYIRWFLQRDFSGAETFWRKYLQGFHQPTRLPERTAQRQTAGEQYGEQRIVLPSGTMRALQRLAQSHRVTVNTVIQAVWALLLSRYSGESDVLFGVTVSGRSEELPAGDAMLGLFINTVPLRIRMAPISLLGEWLREIQLLNVDLRRYEFSPLEQVQGWSEIRRGTALFDSVLVFQNYLIDDAVQEYGRTLGVETLDVEGWTNYPLTITVIPEEQLTVIFSYATHRLSDETVSQFARHWTGIIDSMIAMTDARLADLSFLSGEDRQHLLVDWNDSQRPYPSDRCLHELFEAQVDRTPDKIAVSFEGGDLTYLELNARANQLAHFLIRQGVGQDVLVGICLERSQDMLVAMLGVLKAGGAYVPLDPTYPRERLTYMLHDAQMPVVVTHRRLLDGVATDAVRLIDMDDWHRIAGESGGKPRVSQTSDNLAYVIYTSGSTGRPKGVMIRHRGVVNFLLSMQEELSLSGDEVIAATTSVSFDIAVLEIFLPLLVGAKTVVISRDVVVDGQRLSQELVRIGATLMQATPSGWRLLLSAATIPRLRVLCGGEAFPRELAQEFLANHLEPWNLYGPTETTVWSMMTRLTGADEAIPLGRPIANTQIYLLDSDFTLVPIGVPGELYIGGDGLARGYWRRPELTAERFMPDPFSVEPGSRLYRTGDQARYRSDGTLEFLGRVDHQVKLRGYRIELGEIESCLNRHPQITQGVVLAREDGHGTRLVAYATQVLGSPIVEQELKEFLQARLPEYMVPSTFVFLDAFPLTPNGKVDRKALPVPGGDRAIDQYVAPRRAVEEILAGIWTEALGVTPIGLHDNFFDLGGHSMIATQVISRIRTAFQIELPLRSLFDAPMIEGLARAVEAARGAASGIQTPPLVRCNREGPAPLSFAQQRLWFLWQLEPTSPLYNIAMALRWIGALDVSALQKSIDELVRRHEVLRTTFVMVEGQPRQVIAPDLMIPIQTRDLRNMPNDEQPTQVQCLADEAARRPFDLVSGPLMRAGLLRLGEQEHVLLLTVHHIVSDGWSMNILTREANALYRAFAEAEPSSLQPLPLQYVDFAQWQRKWLEGGVLESQLAYWKRQLSEIPILEMPTDRPRPAVQTYRGAVYNVALSLALTEQLKALSRRQGVTLFMTLLAGLKVLLKYETGQYDITVGTDVANRHLVETEDIVGFFVNQLVLRTNVQDDLAFDRLLNHVREVTLAAYAHQDVPFEMLVATLKSKRDVRYSPLFQVKLILQNISPPSAEFPGLAVSTVNVEKTTAELDLLLNFEETSEGLNGCFEYNTDLFDVSSIVRLAEHFTTILTQAVMQPGIALKQLEEILAETDSRQRRLKQQELSKANYRKLKSTQRKAVGPSI